MIDIDPEIKSLILEIRLGQKKLKVLSEAIAELKDRIKPLEDEHQQVYKTLENNKGLLNHKICNDEVE